MGRFLNVLLGAVVLFIGINGFANLIEISILLIWSALIFIGTVIIGNFFWGRRNVLQQF